jgi:hypothetical protein
MQGSRVKHPVMDSSRDGFELLFHALPQGRGMNGAAAKRARAILRPLLHAHTSAKV